MQTAQPYLRSAAASILQPVTGAWRGALLFLWDACFLSAARCQTSRLHLLSRKRFKEKRRRRREGGERQSRAGVRAYTEPSRCCFPGRRGPAVRKQPLGWRVVNTGVVGAGEAIGGTFYRHSQPLKQANVNAASLLIKHCNRTEQVYFIPPTLGNYIVFPLNRFFFALPHKPAYLHYHCALVSLFFCYLFQAQFSFCCAFAGVSDPKWRPEVSK